MRPRAIISLLGTVWLFLVCGCPKQQPPAISGRGPVSPPQVTAYLDLARGCMSETEHILEEATAEYSDELDIRILDISERPGTTQSGAATLQEPAIFFGGNHTVSWPPKTGPPRVVRFTLPPGYYWRRADLRAALEALARGRLRAATEDELKNLRKLPPKKIEIAGQTFRKGSQPPVGQLLINGELVVSITQGTGKKGPGARMKAAVGVLKKWTEEWYSPTQLAVEAEADEAVLKADGTPVLTATAADAQAAGVSTPEVLAQQWLVAIAGPMLCPTD